MSYKTALVTGASRGIGRAIARALAAANYHLILTCRNNSTLLTELAVELTETYHIECTTFTGDMGDAPTVEKLFAKIQAKYPTLDVIVNNAGISMVGLLTDMSYAEWNEIIQTNLSSVFYICKNGIPMMLSRKQGKIVNISSVWGVVGASCEVAYSATKGAVGAFTQALAKELAPSGIQVNAIACGAIDTEMNSHLSAEELEDLAAEIPAGRLGKPEEVAKLVCDLCSNHDYLTGQIIRLDGGWI